MFLKLILLCLAILSGLSSTFLYLVPITILFFTLLIKLVEDEKNLKNIFFLGWLFGFGFFLGSMHWIIFPFMIYEKHYILVPFVLLIFPAILGIFFAIPTFTTKLSNHFIKQEFVFLRSFFISLFFFISEIARSKLFGGLPFNLHSHIWTFFPDFIQISSFTGTFGLSFLTIYWIITQANLYKKRILFFISFFSLPLFLFSFTFFSKQNNQNEADKFINVRIVQPNIPQSEKWNRDLIPSHIEKILFLSRQNNQLDKNATQILVWPEVAIPFYLNEEEELLSYIQSELPRNSILITGGLRRNLNNKNLKIYNSFYIIDNENVKFYDKKKLVPFGEFIPLKQIFGFSKITDGSTDFSVGVKEQNLSVNIDNIELQVEPSICFESIFQSFPLIPPDILINVTNDAWFGNTIGPRQHLAASIFRAVEKGVPLVRSANSGISAFINSEGKVVKRIKLNESGYINLRVSLTKNLTVFTKTKNYINLALLCFLLLLSLVMDFLNKRKFN